MYVLINRIMLLALESETANNFMLFTFGFVVIFGYFGYRLVYRWLDHLATTQRIDQYAKHFGDNKHLISSFGENIFGLMSSIESHLYIATIFECISEPITSIIGTVMGFISDQNSRSTLADLCRPLLGAITSHISPPMPATATRTKVNRRGNLRIPRYENIRGVECPLNRVCPRPRKNVNPSRPVNCRYTNIDTPINFFPHAENLPVELNLNNSPQPQSYQKMMTNLFTDLKMELGNNPVINSFMDLISAKLNSYDLTNPLSMNLNLIEFNSYMMSILEGSPVPELINSAIKSCVNDPTRVSLIKDIFCVINSISTTKMIPDVEDLWLLSQKFSSKYMEIPLESMPPIDPLVLSMLKPMFDQYNERVRQLQPSPTDEGASKIFNDCFSASTLSDFLAKRYSPVNMSMQGDNNNNNNTAILNMIERVNRQHATGVTGSNLVQPIPVIPNPWFAISASAVIPLNIADIFEFATTFQESGSEQINYASLDYSSATELLSTLREKLGLSSNFIITENSLNAFPRPNQDVANFLRLTCFIQLGKDLFMAVYELVSEEEVDLIIDNTDVEVTNTETNTPTEITII